MDNAPFKQKGSKKVRESQGLRELTLVSGHWVPEGLTHKGKKVRSGIFVNTTGIVEEEKERLFDLAKQEVGEEAEGLGLYEVIDL